MSSKLEDLINDALARGEFVHLSVVANGKGFKATFASASRADGYAVGEAADPVSAMLKAIGAAPMIKRKRMVMVCAPDGGKTTASRIFEVDDQALT